MDLEPSFQDICEDVARIYGYENIPTTLAKTRDKGALTYIQKRIRTLRHTLCDMGLNETISYSLIAKKDLNLYTLNEEETIEPLMPLTEDRAVMRQSLLNGVIDAIEYNNARKISNVNLFEIGNVYTKDKESLHLAIAMTGLFEKQEWNGFKQAADFYLLKGVLDNALAKLGVSVTYSANNRFKNFHPGRTASIIFDNKMIGVIGQLHPKFAKDNDLGLTVALELDLKPILENVCKFTYSPINKFPTIERDLAIVVKKDVPSIDVEALIKQTGKKILTKVELFDLYTGENVGADEKSLAFTLTFEDPTKTLETETVDKAIKSILNRLEYVYKARLR
jgi:phenylalanyl-tRNA synthetase beta chain